MKKNPLAPESRYAAPAVRSFVLRTETGLCASPDNQSGELPAVEEEGAGLDEWRFW